MKKERILVLCAHSDDQIIGPGGTCAKYAKQGKEIKTVILSYGEGSHPHLKTEVIITKRVKEAQAADKIIGGKGVIFLGIPDTKIAQELKNKKVEGRLIRIIKDFRPHKIFTHSDQDAHPDHRALVKKVLEIIEVTKYPGAVYMFDVWNLFRIEKRDLPKMYVDISSTFKIKQKALDAFSSQWLSMLLLKFSIYFNAIKHGWTIKKKFAERFYKIR